MYHVVGLTIRANGLSLALCSNWVQSKKSAQNRLKITQRLVTVNINIWWKFQVPKIFPFRVKPEIEIDFATNGCFVNLTHFFLVFRRFSLCSLTIQLKKISKKWSPKSTKYIHFPILLLFSFWRSERSFNQKRVHSHKKQTKKTNIVKPTLCSESKNFISVQFLLLREYNCIKVYNCI